MISVAVKETGEVLGFPDTMSATDIDNAIRGDLYGEVRQTKPNFFNDKVRPALDKIGINISSPNFTINKVATDSLAMGVRGFGRGITFGLINPSKQSQEIFEAEKEHKIATSIGEAIGTLGSLLVTSGIGSAVKLPEIAANVGRTVFTRTGSVKAGLLASATTRVGGIGALFGSIREGGQQINEVFESGKMPDLVKVGESALKEAGIFTLYGFTGAMFRSIPIGATAMAGVAYTVSKAEGHDEADSLLNAAIMGVFHTVLAPRRPTFKVQMNEVRPKKMIEMLDGLKAKYIKTKNPVINNSVAIRSAQESSLSAMDNAVSDVMTQLNTDVSGVASQNGRVSFSQDIINKANLQGGIGGFHKRTVDYLSDFTSQNNVNVAVVGGKEGQTEGIVSDWGGNKFSVRSKSDKSLVEKEKDDVVKLNELVEGWGSSRERIVKGGKKQEGYVDPDSGYIWWKGKKSWEVEVALDKPSMPLEIEKVIEDILPEVKGDAEGMPKQQKEGAEAAKKVELTPEEQEAAEAIKSGMSEEGFVNSYNVFHGTPAKIEGGALKFGAGKQIKKGGHMGGHFLTNEEDVARAFQLGGKIYRAKGDIKNQVFDVNANKKLFKDYIGKEYTDIDGERIVFTKDDFDLMFPNNQDSDWATVNVELSNQFAKEQGKIGIAIKEFAGGKEGITYQLFKDEIPVFTEDELRSIYKNIKQKMSIDKAEGMAEKPIDPMSRPLTELATDPDLPATDRPYRTHSMPMRLEKPKGVVLPASAVDVIDALQDTLKVFGSKVPIKFGKVKKKNTLGFFREQTEIIRVRTANDIVTATHEVGHYIERLVVADFVGDKGIKKTRKIKIGEETYIANIKMSTKNAVLAEIFPDEYVKELHKLGVALYKEEEPHNGYVSEGIAEFMRLWVTDRDMAFKQAPEFSKWFTGNFLKEYPEGAKALDKAQDFAHRWQQEGSVERAKQSIYEPERIKERIRLAKQWIENSKSEISSKMIDIFSPIKELSKEVELRLGKKLPMSENPYLTASALRTTHDARTKYMVKNGMIDLSGNIVGRPLSDITKLVKGRKEDFTVYLWAKRAVALWADPRHASKGGRNPGISLQDAKQIIKELDSPAFQEAAQQVYDWQDGVMNYAAQASPTFRETVEKMRKIDPGFYVPLHREFAQLSGLWANSSSKPKAMSGKLSSRLKGSGRRVKDIFPTIISNARNTLKAAHNRMVVDQMINIANKVPGLGYLIEKVPADTVPMATRKVSELLTEVNRKLQDIGAGIKIKGEAVSLEDIADVFNESISFFGASPVQKGENPIIPIMENGKVSYYEVDGHLYNALQGMEVFRLPDVCGFPIMDWIFGVPARMFRLGTTGLRATFSLITNPTRDLQTLYMNTQASANPAELFANWLGLMVDSGFRQIRGGDTNNPYIDIFMRLGGEMAQPLGQDVSHTKRAARRLFESKFQRIIDVGNVYDWLVDVLQFPETASRVTELKLLIKDMGWQPGEPITLEQSLKLLLASKQVTTDFTAMGELARVLNQMIPFFNAAIQGPRAHIRAYNRNKRAFILKGLALTAATLALWWRQKDEQWYKEAPAFEKYGYWNFPININGKNEMIRIPRAFEVGQVFASMPEAMIDSWYKQNPEAVKEWFGVFQDVLAPGMLPVLVEESAEQLSNRDFFFDMPIVSKSFERKPPAEQYDEYSSRIAIFLGEKLNVSPKRIDHAIKGIFGTGASDIMSLMGLGAEGVDREKTPSDLPVVGTLFRRGGEMGLRQKSVNELYDLLESARIKQASDKFPETDKEKNLRLMLNDAAKAVTALSFIRAHAKETDLQRKITVEMVDIAKDAVEHYKKGELRRGKFTAKKKKAEAKKERIKK